MSGPAWRRLASASAPWVSGWGTGSRLSLREAGAPYLPAAQPADPPPGPVLPHAPPPQTSRLDRRWLPHPRLRRPCTNKPRSWGLEQIDPGPENLTAYRPPNNPFWSSKAAMCSGACDKDMGMCYCPSHTPFGHIPAGEGSLPGKYVLARRFRWEKTEPRPVFRL